MPTGHRNLTDGVPGRPAGLWTQVHLPPTAPSSITHITFSAGPAPQHRAGLPEPRVCVGAQGRERPCRVRCRYLPWPLA